MNHRILLVLAAPLLARGLPAQQLLWQIPSPPSTTERLEMMSFTDFDHDGYQDLLEQVYPNPLSVPAIQIISGRDGSMLWSMVPGGLIRVRYAGDVDGDGEPDLALVRSCCAGIYVNVLRIFSIRTNLPIWENNGTFSNGYGTEVLGNLDVNGDGRSDIVTITQSFTHSTVYVYDSSGATLYTLPFLAQNRIAISLANLGDLNGDGGDDFVVGANDATNRGVLVVVSGRTGATIRQSFGLLPGDRLSEHASNLGDLDGDGINDYGGFPYWSASRAMAVMFSGATGSLIHALPLYGNSVVTGDDVDLDSVPDIIYGADFTIVPQLVYGSTRAVSGRDGTQLWRVDNFQPPFGSGSNGSSGWMESSASLGVQPGSPYPVVAWLDLHWYTAGTSIGRIRAYRTPRDGQGPITGTPCSSTGSFPQIGARQTATGARVTIAHAPPAALAWLCFALPNQASYGGHALPLDLGTFGLPGCTLYVGPEALHMRVTGTNGIDRGYAAVDLPFQLTAASLGTSLVAQWLVLDPATLGHAATPMHQLRGQ